MNDKRDLNKRWSGGNIHWQRDGRPLYVIERKVAGKRFHISTRCHAETAAAEHLKRFEADPFGYEREMKEGRPNTGGLFLSSELVLEYRRWLLERDHPTTTRYANEMAHRLAEWCEDLRNRDLRRLDLGFVKECLARRVTCRQHRIIALKGLCAWLRTEKHVLDRRDDATLDLAVPQANPEKRRRRKVVPHEDVRAVLAHLAPAYRDCLLLVANTGWHTTELERFARSAESRIASGRGEVLAVLQVLHKSGDTTRTPIVDPDVLGAAQRIRERGGLPRRLNDALKKACAAAGVSQFGFGVMRHSFATWAVEGGADAQAVAAFVGHKSKSTTERFYIDTAVPTVVVRVPRLT